MKLRLFGGHKPVCPDRLSGEISCLARGGVRDVWMGGRIASDIAGSGSTGFATGALTFSSSKRISERMGGPAWLA